MKHYYALDWTKGVGTYDFDSMLPIGVLHVFDSPRDRDNYVSSNDNATVMNANAAMKMMVRDIFRYSPNQAYFRFITESYYININTIDEIIRDYRSLEVQK